MSPESAVPKTKACHLPLETEMQSLSLSDWQQMLEMGPAFAIVDQSPGVGRAPQFNASGGGMGLAIATPRGRSCSVGARPPGSSPCWLRPTMTLSRRHEVVRR